MQEVFAKEKNIFVSSVKVFVMQNYHLFPLKRSFITHVFSQAPSVSTMTHFSVVFNCGLTSDINSMLIFTIIQGTMLS